VHELVLAEEGKEKVTDVPQHHMYTGVDNVHATFGRTNGRLPLPQANTKQRIEAKFSKKFSSGHVITTSPRHE
jgi:hypothetical protein